MQTFVAVSAAIAFVFVLAMLYLAQTTTVSTRGYEAQRLEQVRDELRRQNALLQVENARLDSPARIEAEAQKLGLTRVTFIPLVQLEPNVTTAKR
jgi:cell division protein FtsL